MHRTEQRGVSIWYTMLGIACVTPATFLTIWGNREAGKLGGMIGLVLGLGLSPVGFYTWEHLSKYWWEWRFDPSVRWNIRALTLLLGICFYAVICSAAGAFFEAFLIRYFGIPYTGFLH